MELPRLRGLRRSGARQLGQAMAATVVALPVLGLVIGGAIQLALVFEAKNTLNHATLQAARAGMVGNGRFGPITTGLTRAMVPLYNPSDRADRQRVFEKVVFPDVVRNTCVRILNPTLEAIDDHGGTQANEEGGPFTRFGSELKNDEMAVLDDAVGATSGVNIQDANLLKLYVVYGARLQIPIIGPLIASTLALDTDRWEPFELELLRNNRLPVVSTATVRMQSDMDSSTSFFTTNTLMLNRSVLRTGPLCEGNLLPKGFFNLVADFLDVSLVGQICVLKNSIDVLENSPACAQCLKRAKRKIPGPDTVKDCKKCFDGLKGLVDCAIDESRRDD